MGSAGRFGCLVLVLIGLSASWAATPARAQEAFTCALDGVDLAVAEGEIVSLLGPSGAGKTTVLRSILGAMKPSSGYEREITALCIRALLEELDPVTISPTPKAGDGTAAEPISDGYLVFDYNDAGNYIPVVGASTGLPVHGGFLHPSVLDIADRALDQQALILALDRVERSILRELDRLVEERRGNQQVGTADGRRRASGDQVSRMSASASESAQDVENQRAQAPNAPSGSVSEADRIHRLRLDTFSTLAFDDTGNAHTELSCRKGVQAWVYEVPEGLTPSALINRHVAEVDLLFVTCPGGFEVYGPGQ